MAENPCQKRAGRNGRQGQVLHWRKSASGASGTRFYGKKYTLCRGPEKGSRRAADIPARAHWHLIFSRREKINTMTTLSRFRNRTQPGVGTSYLDRFFRNDPFSLWDSGNQFVNTVPALNISEEDKQYRVELAAPGMKKDDFNIDVDDNMVTISSEKESETNDEADDKKYSFREYNYSSFSRSFSLPENADAEKISAKYADGVLCLTVPKKEQQLKAKKNKIRVD